MKPVLCTLFDRKYLARGLALHASLLQHHPQGFTLHILALDEMVRAAVAGLPNVQVTPVSALEYEYPKLPERRARRSAVEYYWTLTPFWMRFLQQQGNYRELTYLDADAFLFGALDAVYEEIGTAPVAIVPHRFPHALAWREQHNGKFNVNFVYVRNNKNGTTCLRDWMEQCAAWCYARTEHAPDGSLLFGDQGYLDQWEERYKAHVVEHIGANLAPWNQAQYDYCYDQRLYVIERREVAALGEVGVKRIQPVLFYHFHGLEFRNGSMEQGGYARTLKREVLEHLYDPYLKQIARIEQSLGA